MGQTWCQGLGPQRYIVEDAQQKADECKSILEYVAHFRVLLGDLKTTSWEPQKGHGAREAQRIAREQRARRLLARREARGRQHKFEVIGSCHSCRRCNRRAFTSNRFPPRAMPVD